MDDANKRRLLCSVIIAAAVLMAGDHPVSGQQSPDNCPVRYRRDPAAAAQARSVKQAELARRGVPERYRALLDRIECVGCIEAAADTLNMLVIYSDEHAPRSGDGRPMPKVHYKWSASRERHLRDDLAAGRIKAFYVFLNPSKCSCCPEATKSATAYADWNPELEANMSQVVVVDDPQQLGPLPEDLKRPEPSSQMPIPDVEIVRKPARRYVHVMCAACQPLADQWNMVAGTLDYLWDRKASLIEQISLTVGAINTRQNQITDLRYQQQFDSTFNQSANQAIDDLQKINDAQEESVARNERRLQDVERDIAETRARMDALMQKIVECEKTCRKTTTAATTPTGTTPSGPIVTDTPPATATQPNPPLAAPIPGVCPQCQAAAAELARLEALIAQRSAELAALRDAMGRTGSQIANIERLRNDAAARGDGQRASELDARLPDQRAQQAGRRAREFEMTEELGRLNDALQAAVRALEACLRGCGQIMANMPRYRQYGSGLEAPLSSRRLDAGPPPAVAKCQLCESLAKQLADAHRRLEELAERANREAILTDFEEFEEQRVRVDNLRQQLDACNAKCQTSTTTGNLNAAGVDGAAKVPAVPPAPVCPQCQAAAAEVARLETLIRQGNADLVPLRQQGSLNSSHIANIEMLRDAALRAGNRARASELDARLPGLREANARLRAREFEIQEDLRRLGDALDAAVRALEECLKKCGQTMGMFREYGAYGADRPSRMQEVEAGPLPAPRGCKECEALEQQLRAEHQKLEELAKLANARMRSDEFEEFEEQRAKVEDLQRKLDACKCSTTTNTTSNTAGATPQPPGTTPGTPAGTTPPSPTPTGTPNPPPPPEPPPPPIETPTTPTLSLQDFNLPRSTPVNTPATGAPIAPAPAPQTGGVRGNFSVREVARCPECAALANEVNALAAQLNALDAQRVELGDQDRVLRGQLEEADLRLREAARAGNKELVAQLGQQLRDIVNQRTELSRKGDPLDARRDELHNAWSAKKAELADCHRKCVRTPGGAADNVATGGLDLTAVTPIPNSPGARCAECQEIADRLAGARRAEALSRSQTNALRDQREAADEEVRGQASAHAALLGGGAAQSALTEAEAAWRAAGARAQILEAQYNQALWRHLAVEQQVQRLEAQLRACNLRCTTASATATGGTGTSPTGAGGDPDPMAACPDCVQAETELETAQDELREAFDRLDSIARQQRELETALSQTKDPRIQKGLADQLEVLARNHSATRAREEKLSADVTGLRSRLEGCNKGCAKPKNTTTGDTSGTTGNPPPTTPDPPPPPPPDPPKPPAPNTTSMNTPATNTPAMNANALGGLPAEPVCAGSDCFDGMEPAAWNTSNNAEVEPRIQLKMSDIIVEVVIQPMQRAQVRSWFNPLGFLTTSVAENVERWRGSVGPRPLINPRDLLEVENYSAGQSIGLPQGVHLLLADRGGSTGKTLGMQILNLTGRPVRLASMPFAIEPIKQQAQQRVQQAFSRLAKSAPVNVDLAGYCVEFLKLPPSAGQIFRLAPPAVQKKYEAMSKVLRSAYRVQQAGLLHPDSNPASYTDTIKQWALWTVEQNFNESRFTDAFLGHSRKNIEAARQPWTRQLDEMIRKLAPNRWRDIATLLQGAGLPVPTAPAR